MSRRPLPHPFPSLRTQRGKTVLRLPFRIAGKLTSSVLGVDNRHLHRHDISNTFLPSFIPKFACFNLRFISSEPLSQNLHWFVEIPIFKLKLKGVTLVRARTIIFLSLSAMALMTALNALPTVADASTILDKIRFFAFLFLSGVFLVIAKRPTA